jgi:hypothetical protein
MRVNFSFWQAHCHLGAPNMNPTLTIPRIRAPLA